MRRTYFISFLIILFISCSSGGDKKLTFGSLDLYYTSDITTYEAEDVGDYFSGIGFGIGDTKEVVKLSKSNDRYMVQFVMPDGQVKLENIWKRYGQGISQNVLKGAPVDVDLCDENFNSLKFLGSD
ncbi:MAG: hypothetical protein KJO39_11700 [Bacteroidia bacterium]|nr:hypothetical protein [Bacteroidia bacterium]NNF31746.1 hypothetical protein [Flavobacteriaceae bacterium]NNJ81093.1 hypothetical protein [Flavobacteriaceae bacterium]NNK55260.1 hypothetical protein [Flavobacteriaceae bacterium]NNM10255.1 hypothetical protein [Flavobacteriaceae bacterium]